MKSDSQNEKKFHAVKSAKKVTKKPLKSLKLSPLILALPLPLVDHLTELPVVQLVVSTGVELTEGHLDLVIREVGADRHKLLQS